MDDPTARHIRQMEKILGEWDRVLAAAETDAGIALSELVKARDYLEAQIAEWKDGEAAASRGSPLDGP